MNNLSVVVREIVAATDYPAEDLLDGVTIEPPHRGEYGDAPGIVRFTRFVREEGGNKKLSYYKGGYIEQHARVCSVDLPEGVWERLELACLAEDPALKGRKLVGGVVIRSQHAYFLPEGEDQQWVSNDVIDLS